MKPTKMHFPQASKAIISLQRNSWPAYTMKPNIRGHTIIFTLKRSFMTTFILKTMNLQMEELGDHGYTFFCESCFT